MLTLDSILDTPWVDLTPSEREQHRDFCRDMCTHCEAHRALFWCPACSQEEEAGVDGYGRVCGGALEELTREPDPKAWIEDRL